MMSFEFIKLPTSVKNQIENTFDLLKEVFKSDLLGVYLYGSFVVSGLQKYSDIDLFVVLNRPSAKEEKNKLIKVLLEISGIYMKDEKRPIELTIVEKLAVNPWHYPPKFDFQYGEWFRKEFESGNTEPYNTKEMPDLAIIITQLLLANFVLMGPNPKKLLPEVPYKDFITAISEGLEELNANLSDDVRNVLLTLARIWHTLQTNIISPKPDAADWVVKLLPEEYALVLNRAKEVCVGVREEYWDDMEKNIKPCAEYMLGKINDQIAQVLLSDGRGAQIKL